MDDHLMQEPRIRRIVRRPIDPVPAPPRDDAPAPRVPTPRAAGHDEHGGR
jgi:hypothetical protein